MDEEERLRWARVALDGVSVGDALGREYALDADWTERRRRREVPARAWCWTDDTAMACAVVTVLERAGAIDPDELAGELVRAFERDPPRAVVRSSPVVGMTGHGTRGDRDVVLRGDDRARG